MKKVGIFYGSDGGNTQSACRKIMEALGEENAVLQDIAKSSKEDVLKFDNLILASSTYGSGELQDDWDRILDQFSPSDFGSKVIALVGMGDQDTYSDTYCDCLFYLYEKTKEATIIGQTKADGYDFGDSKAIINGEFIGLALDEDNQDDLTDSRIREWVENIKPQFQ
ncbi:flavodoxin [Helicobacter enhydrae]|uniref:Flavodoxin n=1 Tax=Helicobacter enhydrae TaxID=222136 RepID=A0A1B1U5T7_9HELI|nr:flavodoxin [Helicobacter enhydrae]ANV98062.1 flavodoxin [Helicobacter enhydrae]